MLIPVGAALTARDSVVETVQPYTNPSTAQREVEKLQRRVGSTLQKFERRGTRARNRLERRVKRTRTRVERQVRQRRNQVERTVTRNSRQVARDLRSARRDFVRGDFGRGIDRVGDLAGDVSPLA
ncbi:MAG: hypothetical protein JOZ25_01495 [Actinobacteria bacterium]|nr:hypothetical protein [Actinomycetota bacterium]